MSSDPSALEAPQLHKYGTWQSCIYCSLPCCLGVAVLAYMLSTFALIFFYIFSSLLFPFIQPWERSERLTVSPFVLGVARHQRKLKQEASLFFTVAFGSTASPGWPRLDDDKGSGLLWARCSHRQTLRVWCNWEQSPSSLRCPRQLSASAWVLTMKLICCHWGDGVR